ncbi:hypothetical protein ACFO4N_14825 [Camelliibacillus cellulosilyticus]|uniref:Uncharacterized protein n=1 Tax=Camelliibacillus cellulosilyticus TaxID=2174486 RepID=A0ABV9GTL2_9BACL
MKKSLLLIIFITLLALVLIGIKIYPKVYTNTNKQLVNKKEAIPLQNSQNNQNVKGDQSHRDPTKESTFPFESIKREKLAKKYPEKFAIVNKMYYSWDFINSIQGEFERINYKMGETSYGKFYVDLIEKRNRATSKRYENGKLVETENILFKDGAAIRQMPSKHIYYVETKAENTSKNTDAFIYQYLSLFNDDITNSEWFALIYNNYANWSYKIGSLNGMEIYEIKGKIPPGISESLSGHFTMGISRQTGVLLDLKCYDQKSKLSLSITTKNIKINNGIPSNVFELNITDNKKVSKREYNLSGVGANAETNKTGGIDTSHD